MLIMTICKFEGNCTKAGPKLRYARVWGGEHISLKFPGSASLLVSHLLIWKLQCRNRQLTCTGSRHSF